MSGSRFSIFTKMPGGSTPPPEVPTFDTVILSFAGGTENFGMLGDLYFGTSGTSGEGYSTNKAAFLVAHPALTHQTFAGIASAGSFTDPAPVLSGFSTVYPSPLVGNSIVYDTACSIMPNQPMPWCSLGNNGGPNSVILTFSPEVNAVGFNVAVFPAPANVLVGIYTGGLGGTLLDGQLFTAHNPGLFDVFYGYSRP